VLTERATARGRNLDVPAKVGNAAVEQCVEFFRHRAHRHQRQDTDHDAADRQRVAQLSPRQISNDFHDCSSSGWVKRLTAG
jgi:hypothetical protein